MRWWLKWCRGVPQWKRIRIVMEGDRRSWGWKWDEARMKMDRSCLRVDGWEQGWSPEKLSQACHPVLARPPWSSDGRGWSGSPLVQGLVRLRREHPFGSRSHKKQRRQCYCPLWYCWSVRICQRLSDIEAGEVDGGRRRYWRMADRSRILFDITQQQ